MKNLKEKHLDKDGNAILSEDAQRYVDKLWQCEPPCDSFGICDNCAEKTIFRIGYAYGVKAMFLDHEKFCEEAQEKTDADFKVVRECAERLKEQNKKLIEALWCIALNDIVNFPGALAHNTLKDLGIK